MSLGVSVLCIVVSVPWVTLLSVDVVFPVHTHLWIEMQIFSLHYMMQNFRLLNVLEAKRASHRH